MKGRCRVARRGKYGAEKRQKEIKKKKKRQEKLERKQLKKQTNAEGDQQVDTESPAEGGDTEIPAKTDSPIGTESS
jgi:hypothetical protein